MPQDDEVQGSKPYRNPEFTLRFDRETTRVSATLWGLAVSLPNGRPEGAPGGPAIPVVVLEAVLPPNTAIREVRVTQANVITLSERGGLVAPLQPAAPGAHACLNSDRIRDDGLLTPWPRPKPTPPDPELYKQAIDRGRKLVELSHTDTSGPQSIVTLIVRPIALDQDGTLLLRQSIQVTLVLQDVDPHERGTDRVAITSRAQAERWTELAKSRVINADAVIDLGSIIGRVPISAEYLIITDNQRWDASAVRPIGPAGGDLVAEFERLAEAKRAKGLTARVITITDIVNGVYGRFNGYCRRDLQEVLREFIKFAHANWGTAWLLLGGDIDIVPARNIVGFAGGFSPVATDPPEPGNSFWTGTFLKIRADVSADTPLLRVSDGRRVPYDAAGTSSTTHLGWYFTDASYTMRSTMATAFVRVNGPAAQINTELFWLTGDNTIPTDLYYGDVGGYPERSANGSLVRAGGIVVAGALARICGGHDWDSINNGLYGQWNWNGDLDGVHYRADISVGRAPAGNAVQAKTFVDKVLHYERAGWYFSTSWLNKLLMVSANWGGRTACFAADPLVANRYIKRAGEDHAVIQLAAPTLAPSFKVVSVLSEPDQREIPFRVDASASVRGWRFARSATDPSPSVISIPMPWGATIQLPMPSQWIVVYGAAGEMAPLYFILDETAADDSMTDQEALRVQLSADVPNWSNVRRLYEDEIDLAPAVGPPVEHLIGARLQQRLNEGQHIVSLSGHGWWGGCCGLDPSMGAGLSNGGQTFVVYADSCFTNQFDVDDAVSELLVQNTQGGAVAYVGNTRFSWINVGDDFQRNFFKGLLSVRALGLLHDRRLAMVNANTGFWKVYNRWSIFSLNLIGDPEMRVWTHRPRTICLRVQRPLRIDDLISIQVALDGEPAPGALVTVRQGDFSRQVVADRLGFAHVDLEGSKPGHLSITAFHPLGALTNETFEVQGPEWIEARITALRVVAEGQAEVEVATPAGERTMTVASGSKELLAVLGQAAFCCEKALRLAVVDGNRIEAAETTRSQNGCHDLKTA